MFLQWKLRRAEKRAKKLFEKIQYLREIHGYALMADTVQIPQGYPDPGEYDAGMIEQELDRQWLLYQDATAAVALLRAQTLYRRRKA